MKKILFVLISLFFLSCDDNKYDGYILHDSSGKRYMLRYNINANYFVKEESLIIDGKDTLVVFR